MPRKKDDDQQRAADRLFTEGRSVRYVARKLKVSTGWAGKLREHWRASMAPTPPVASTIQPAAGLPVSPADAKTARDIEALLRWAGKTDLSEIEFAEIYRWSREVCPYTERRNQLFMKWMETQAYPGSPDDPKAVASKEPASEIQAEERADLSAPTEPESPTQEEKAEAQKAADVVLSRYKALHLSGDLENILKIAKNAQGLFSEAQAKSAQTFVDDPMRGWRP